jgi:hypothetical protein
MDKSTGSTDPGRFVTDIRDQSVLFFNANINVDNFIFPHNERPHFFKSTTASLVQRYLVSGFVVATNQPKTTITTLVRYV